MAKGASWLKIYSSLLFMSLGVFDVAKNRAFSLFGKNQAVFGSLGSLVVGAAV